MTTEYDISKQIENQEMKVCTKCGESFPATIEYFYLRKDSGILIGRCKKCVSAVRSSWYFKNKERISEISKESYKENREEKIKYQKKYRSENKELLFERKQKYRLKYKDKIRAHKKKYSEENKHVIAAYRKKNKLAIVEQQKIYAQRKAKYSLETVTQLDKYENIRLSAMGEFAEVKCAYCGMWIMPTNSQIKNRIASIYGRKQGESRIYCNNSTGKLGCREACPTYNQTLYPKGHKPATSREVDPYTRQLCFERDNYECQTCGVNIEDAQLHCHHIVGVAHSPVEQNDVENTITLCKKCHKALHKMPGCTYGDYKCA